MENLSLSESREQAENSPYKLGKCPRSYSKPEICDFQTNEKDV